MLDVFSQESLERHVLVGPRVSDYSAGLGLGSDDLVYDMRADWQRAALRAAIAGRVAIVSNAGEVQLNRRRTKIALADIPTAALVRLRGGKVVQSGVGFRRPNGGYPWQVALVTAMSGIASWRDAPSRHHGRVGQVTPDWAFAIAGSGAKAVRRDLLVVTMRGDRAVPTSAFVDAVKRICDSRNLRPVVINQVVRDLSRSRELASMLGAEFIAPWSGGPHDEFEPVLRDVYARAEFVVSDRLHALVIALTEGAVPVGATRGSVEKLDRTLAAAHIDDVSFDYDAMGETELVDRMEGIIARRGELIEACAWARSDLNDFRERIREYIAVR